MPGFLQLPFSRVLPLVSYQLSCPDSPLPAPPRPSPFRGGGAGGSWAGQLGVLRIAYAVGSLLEMLFCGMQSQLDTASSLVGGLRLSQNDPLQSFTFG